MRITQGTFSYLPDLTDDQIKAQIQYCLDNDWPISVEYTDDPHPRNVYWDMWGLPMFDLQGRGRDHARGERVPQGLPESLHQGERLRPPLRPADDRAQLHRQPARKRSLAFDVERQEYADRQVKYTLHAYATDKPEGQRYGD